MAFIEVADVGVAPPDLGVVWGWSIDLPLPGRRTQDASFEIAGWIHGREVGVRRLEFVVDGRVVRQSGLNMFRSDVAEAFPELPGAGKSGFRVELAMPRSAALEVAVRAVMADDSCLAIGRVVVCRRWREAHDPALRSLVSVVIPCYRQAHFLPEAIESVLAQSYGQVEIVVVDDGSSDNVAAVARRFPGVRYVRQDNEGLSGARNTGLRETNGDCIVFLDADDVLLPDALAIGVQALVDHPECAFVFGHTQSFSDDGSPPTPYTPTFDGDYYESFLGGRCVTAHHAVMYRRAAFEEVGVFDRTLDAAEDFDLYCRIARDYAVHCHGAIVAGYRRHGSSMSADPGGQLSAVLHVQRRQRRYIWKQPRYWRAYRTGLRSWRRLYGSGMVEDLQEDLHKRRWSRAVRGAGALLKAWPRGVAKVVLRQSGTATRAA
jgi:glycosyltransferase involved in cell wall biosynthesis